MTAKNLKNDAYQMKFSYGEGEGGGGGGGGGGVFGVADSEYDFIF